ncbi:hypothetical protein ACHAWX_007620 [Stephanocyclus meneghinianus]
MTTRIRTRDLARRKAFADATAGVIGSLVSMLAFYPVDVWKTSLQAGVSKNDNFILHKSAGDALDEEVDAGLICRKDQDDNGKSSALHRMNHLSELFRGLSYKIMHTTVSSFTYFFVYSLVQSKYASYRRSIASQQGNDRESETHATSAITKLLLTAFSAVINTSITLPLDTISSRIQAGTAGRGGRSTKKTRAEQHHYSTMAKAAGTTAENCFRRSAFNGFAKQSSCISISEDEEYHSANEEEVDDERPTDQKHLQQLYIKSPEKFKFSFSTNLRDEAFATNPNTIPKGRSNNLQKSLNSISSLWNGLLPAVLLCSNPAIQYTLYDTIKSALLLRRLNRLQLSQHGNLPHTHQQNSTQLSSLSMRESFLSGMVSKFFATMATYPLIRAKVLLMVSPPDTLLSGNSPAHYIPATSPYDGNATNINSSSDIPPPNKYPRSLPFLLLYIFRKDGFRGIYQGCSLQLLHTVLKSALLMMVRERITSGTQRLFQVEDA